MPDGRVYVFRLLREAHSGYDRHRPLARACLMSGHARVEECRHLRDAFAIYHGPVSQELTFDDVTATVRDFLKAHPSETVILSVKEESSPSGNTRTFERMFDAAAAKDSVLRVFVTVFRRFVIIS